MPLELLPDDDFVLTLSDNEDIPISDRESEVNEFELPNRKKRKRADESAGRPQKQRKQNSTTAKDYESNSEENDVSSTEEYGVKDDTIDSDFEFDLGTTLVSEAVDDFDGWGSRHNSQTEQAKKRADIDTIIARRATKRSRQAEDVVNGEGAEVNESSEEELESEESDEDEEAPYGEIDFEDENLAPDTFGAGAASESEEASQENGAAPAVDLDDSSVASPVAHPDDLASESESDSESKTSQSDAEEEAKRKAFFAAEIPAQVNKSSSTTSFQLFSLSRPIMRALAALSFVTPTPIQVRTVPIALQGLDVVGSAQTGSGKTAAFLLPILERLLYRPRKIPTTRVVILMPTRELAVQCHQVATAMARYTDITFAQVVGGFSLREQENTLKKRPDVVIATPGRFIDHMRNSASFAVENVEILVLDEADRMLDQGFADELDEILRTIPKSRQTMLFSATMTDSVDKLVRVGMNRPVRVSVDAKKTTVSGLIQEFVRLRPGREEMRLASLCILCTKVLDYSERTIVFFRQKKEAHRVRIIFGLLGIRAGELHGSMSQEQRINAVNAFRDGKTTHLLATDVASRGLDIKNVVSIINYEAPQSHEIYLHRVGRTARAGRSGKACTIAAEPDRKVVKAAVKAARAQGAKVVSRVLETAEVNAMRERVDGLDEEVAGVLKEEKEEKQLTQMEQDVARGQNLVNHHDEIMSRPKRTWFESEKDKKAAKVRAKAELNGTMFKGEKRKLSNKDKKKLDLHRERTEGGRQWKKGKTDAANSGKGERRNKRSKMKAGK